LREFAYLSKIQYYKLISTLLIKIIFLNFLEDLKLLVAIF